MNEFITVKSGDRGLAIMVGEITSWETASPNSTNVTMDRGNIIEVNLTFDAFTQTVLQAGKSSQCQQQNPS